MYHSRIIAESFGKFMVWYDKAEVASTSTTEGQTECLGACGGASARASIMQALFLHDVGLQPGSVMFGFLASLCISLLPAFPGHVESGLWAWVQVTAYRAGCSSKKLVP
jgi:hypothetical protein